MMYLLQCFCKEQGINFLQFQMLPPYNKFRREDQNPDELISTKIEFNKRKQRELDFMKNPISLLLDDSKFLGFPIWKGFGGYSMYQLLVKKYGFMDYRINGIDAHPNEDAQRFIAEVVLKRP